MVSKLRALVFAFVALTLALVGCAGDDDIRLVAEEDLRCDAVTVFTIAGPEEVTRPFLRRSRHECTTYISTSYRIEGCQMVRAYECQECTTGPKICYGAGPITPIY